MMKRVYSYIWIRPAQPGIPEATGRAEIEAESEEDARAKAYARHKASGARIGGVMREKS